MAQALVSGEAKTAVQRRRDEGSGVASVPSLGTMATERKPASPTAASLTAEKALV